MVDYFLGIDSSTQSCTAIVIDFTSYKVIYRHSIVFDQDLPHYKTQNGVYIQEDGKTVHSNPLMWVEALELIFNNLLENNQPIGKIKAISGSGQQHGTVYLNDTFERVLQSLDPDKSLKNQLGNTFSRKTSPV